MRALMIVGLLCSAASGELSVPADVYQQIKRAAAKEWPGDYEMQEYVIKEQVASYLVLHERQPAPQVKPQPSQPKLKPLEQAKAAWLAMSKKERSVFLRWTKRAKSPPKPQPRAVEGGYFQDF